ncbi:MAG TPA: TetR family transcriptional regulator [Caulobacteraceae bacterium]
MDQQRKTEDTLPCAAPLEGSARRPRNAVATRHAILCAARRRFARDGYDQVGCRDIGAEAGVDAALVNRYFGGKEELFAEVLDAVSQGSVDLLSGDRSQFGRRAAEALFLPERGGDAGLEFVNLAVRSAGSPAAREIVRHHMEQQFLGPFAEWVGGEEAGLRARLAASVLVGVVAMQAMLFAPEGGDTQAQAASERLARLLQSLAD